MGKTWIVEDVGIVLWCNSCRGLSGSSNGVLVRGDIQQWRREAAFGLGLACGVFLIWQCCMYVES